MQHRDAKPLVIELQLDEARLYQRMHARRSPLDSEKLRDGRPGPAWSAYRAAEGTPFRWPSNWGVCRVDAGESPDTVADVAHSFLRRRLRESGRLVIVAGDASVGKTTLIRRLLDRGLQIIPVISDWIKDPIKSSSVVSWPTKRDDAYAQIYFFVGQLLSWRYSVILEAPFKVEMTRAPESWCALVEYLCKGCVELDPLLSLLDPIRGLK